MLLLSGSPQNENHSAKVIWLDQSLHCECEEVLSWHLGTKKMVHRRTAAYGLYYHTSEAKYCLDIIKQSGPQKSHMMLSESSSRIEIWIKFLLASRSMLSILIIFYPLKNTVPYTQHLLIHLLFPKTWPCLAYGKCPVKDLSLIIAASNSWWH